MDGLFVEEVAASLVREFLSRKVRGAALRSPGQLLRFGGESGGVPLQLLHLRGGRPSSARCLPRRCPIKAPLSRAGGTTFPRSPFCHRALPASWAGRGRLRGHLPGRGRGAAAQGRRPGSVLPAWFPEHRRQASAQAWRASSTTTPSQDLHPVKKNCPQKEARGPKKFLTVRPLRSCSSTFSSCGPFRL